MTAWQFFLGLWSSMQPLSYLAVVIYAILIIRRVLIILGDLYLWKLSRKHTVLGKSGPITIPVEFL